MAAGKLNWMTATGPKNPERWIYFVVGGAVIVVGVVLAVFMMTAGRLKPGISPGAAASVTDADLAYLVLSPRLAQEFGFDRPGDIRLAVLGLGAAQGKPDPAAIGRKVRTFASKMQVAKLGGMLINGRLKHIQTDEAGAITAFTPLGWDNWQAGQSLLQFYTVDYLLSLVEGVDDVLPLLAGEHEFRAFAAGWLADIGGVVELDRGRVYLALADCLKSAAPEDRPKVMEAMIRWAGPDEAAALASLYQQAETDAVRGGIIARLAAIDPAALQNLLVGLASDPVKLKAAFGIVASLSPDEAALVLDALARSADQRISSAAQAAQRAAIALHPPAASPKAPPGPVTRPVVRPPAVAASRPLPPVRLPISNAATAADAIKSGDISRRHEALRYLESATALDDPKTALAAIEPLLTTSTRDALREALAAYVKWAGPDQAAKLTAMATSGQDIDTAWPTLMVGLMKLDPATGRKIFEARYDQVAFRMPTIIELKRLDSSHESAFWPLLDSPRWEVVKTTAEILGDVGTKTSIPTLEAIVAKAPQRNQAQVKRWVDGAIAKINSRGN